MKTILVTLSSPLEIGGVQTYYNKLKQYWSSDLQLITNQDSALIGRFLPFFGWLKGFFSLLPALRREKPEWVLAGEILPVGTIVYLASFFVRSFKYGVFLHGLDFSMIQKVPRKQWLAKLILHKANIIICANQHTATEVRKLYPDVKNIAVVNPGVEINNLVVKQNNKIKVTEGTFVLLTVGRLIKRKGVDKTLLAIARLKNIIPNLRYVIIGDGPDKQYLEDLIRELQISDIVTMINGANDEEKNQWLTTCDIFIMPTRNIEGDYEGFGIVYLEAGFFGKPVIAGNSGGVSDAVQHERNGLVVDGNNEMEIGEAIVRLYNDNMLRTKLGNQGRELSLASGWEQRVKAIETLLVNV